MLVKSTFCFVGLSNFRMVHLKQYSFIIITSQWVSLHCHIKYFHVCILLQKLQMTYFQLTLLLTLWIKSFQKNGSSWERRGNWYLCITCEGNVEFSTMPLIVRCLSWVKMFVKSSVPPLFWLAVFEQPICKFCLVKPVQRYAGRNAILTVHWTYRQILRQIFDSKWRHVA